MMPSEQACRDDLMSIAEDPSKGTHAGLLLSRYLKVPVKDKGKEHPSARAALHEAAEAAISARDSVSLYQLAYNRWWNGLVKQAVNEELVDDELHVQGRLIVGLGADNVLETGLALHHTYGVPYIPGSALKGLAAHYCNRVWGEDDQEFRRIVQENDDSGHEVERSGCHFRDIFGTQDCAGHIFFHDAWIKPEILPGSLVVDVMTPHHGDYYAKKVYKAGPNIGKMIPPTDFDDPNPVTFLSVAGVFRIAVSCDVPGPEGKRWAVLAMGLLKEALREWGVGGKTSSGYGRLAEATPSSAGRAQTPDATPAKPTRPQYKAGTVLTVERVEEPKGRVWFRAPDGFGGRIVNTPDEELPDVQIGQTIELEVAAVMQRQRTYNFRLPRG